MQPSTPVDSEAATTSDEMVLSDGRIITFYSYKGGTGRSMALANAAWALAMSGKRVLVMDWDLEAPGIHRYFHPFLSDPVLAESDGVLEYLTRLARTAAAEPPGTDWRELPNDYFEEHADCTSYARAVEFPEFPATACLHFIPAGRQDSTYSDRLSLFNFVQFYEQLGGRRFLDAQRTLLRSSYDFILIDSRTGVSDTSGICTVQMPDTLVVCFTLNEQSIRGASGIAADVRKQREKDEEDGIFRIFPMPTRVELSEHDRRLIAMERVKKIFSTYLVDLDAVQTEEYWGQMQVVYIPYYAFEEIPALFGNPANEAISMSAATSAMVRHITRAAVTGPSAALEEAKRRAYLERFLRTAEHPLLLAQRVLEKRASDRDLFRRLLLRFVVTGAGTLPDSAHPIFDMDLTPGEGPILKDLVEAGFIQVDNAELAVLRLASDEFIRWDVLREWIAQDREFLTWRNSLDSVASAWMESRQSDLLLRDERLMNASSWRDRRSDDLSFALRRFIEASEKSDPASVAERFMNQAIPPVDERFFLQFVTAGGGHRFVRTADLFPDAALAAQGAVAGVLREVTSGPHMKVAGDSGYMLLSDELPYRWPRLREWLQSHSLFLSARDETELLARGWNQERRDPKRLLRGEQLDRLLELFKSRLAELPAIVREYLTECERGDPVRRAEEILRSCPADQAEALERLMLRFVQMNEAGESKAVAARNDDLVEPEPEIVKRLVDVSLLDVSGKHGAGSLALNEPGLLVDWPWYRNTIQEDRDFLIFRTRLEEQASAWELSGRKLHLLSAADLAKWNQEPSLADVSKRLRAYLAWAGTRHRWTARRMAMTATTALLLLAAGVYYWFFRNGRVDFFPPEDSAYSRDSRALLIVEAIQRGQLKTGAVDAKLAAALAALGPLAEARGSGTPSNNGWRVVFGQKNDLVASSSERIDVLTPDDNIAQPQFTTRNVAPGAVAVGYDGRTNTIAFSRSPPLLEFVSLQDLKPLRSINLDSNGSIVALAFSPDGSYWATGDDSGVIAVGTSGPATQLHSFRHGSRVNALDWADDNAHLATAGNTNSVSVWDVRTAKPDSTVLDVGSAVHDVRFAPQVKFSLTLATAANDGVRVWTVVGGVPRDIALIKGREARLVAFRDRTLVAAGVVYRSDPNRFLLWNASDGADVATLIDDSAIRALAFSPDKALIATGAGNTVRLWRADSKGTEKTALWELSFGGSVSSVSFSQDSQHLAAGSTDGTYRIWNLNTSAFKVGAALDVERLKRSLCLSSSKSYLPSEEWTKIFPAEKWRTTCP